jgi:NAD-dependent deacetylase
MIPPAIFVLTGAGLSAESGLGTFRDTDGIWQKFRLEDYATPEAFARDPLKVQGFYNARRAGLMHAAPHAAHQALAALQLAFARKGAAVTLCTQNIDDLLEQAGAEEVIHMHGELKMAWCLACDAKSAWDEDIALDSPCPVCGEKGRLRPDVVWFGEMPYHMDLIYERMADAELFVAIGTSGSVYPAAGFVNAARAAGIPCMEINLDPSDNAELFHRSRYGKASETVPAWTAEMIALL